MGNISAPNKSKLKDITLHLTQSFIKYARPGTIRVSPSLFSFHETSMARLTYILAMISFIFIRLNFVQHCLIILFSPAARLEILLVHRRWETQSCASKSSWKGEGLQDATCVCECLCPHKRYGIKSIEECTLSSDRILLIVCLPLKVPRPACESFLSISVNSSSSCARFGSYSLSTMLCPNRNMPLWIGCSFIEPFWPSFPAQIRISNDSRIP